MLFLIGFLAILFGVPLVIGVIVQRQKRVERHSTGRPAGPDDIYAGDIDKLDAYALAAREVRHEIYGSPAPTLTDPARALERTSTYADAVQRYLVAAQRH